MPDIGELIGTGNVAEVFAYGEDVVKLYASPAAKAEAFIEAGNLAIIASRGLPVPVVREVRAYGDRWGLVMSRAPGAPLARLDGGAVELVSGGLEEMIRLQRLLHATREPRLRSLKARLAGKLEQAGITDALRQRLLGRLTALPDGVGVCHGDFHPFNLIGEPGSVTIIDWLDVTSGPAAADVCRSHLLMSAVAPLLAAAYLERIAAESGCSAEEILAWQPILAAARLTEHAGDEARLRQLLADA